MICDSTPHDSFLRSRVQLGNTYKNVGSTRSPQFVRIDKERKTLVINTEQQPWQKADAKKRAKAASHANWDDRKKARELRRELERAAL